MSTGWIKLSEETPKRSDFGPFWVFEEFNNGSSGVFMVEGFDHKRFEGQREGFYSERSGYSDNVKYWMKVEKPEAPEETKK